MNKADLIAKLAPKLNINQDEARVVLNSVLEGIRVALLHAEMLVKAGAQVSLFTLEGEAEWYHEGDFHFPVLSAEREKLQGTLDLAVATMWNTAEFVEQSSKIRKKKYSWNLMNI